MRSSWVRRIIFWHNQVLNISEVSQTPNKKQRINFISFILHFSEKMSKTNCWKIDYMQKALILNLTSAFAQTVYLSCLGPKHFLFSHLFFGGVFTMFWVDDLLFPLCTSPFTWSSSLVWYVIIFMGRWWDGGVEPAGHFSVVGHFSMAQHYSLS